MDLSLLVFYFRENLSNKEIDLSDEEYLLDCFRTSSLILILMKHLDESYLSTVRLKYSCLICNHLSLVYSMVY
jgi:hypothetical protein